MATRGRPLKPLDTDASMAAWLGAELRARRQACGLTQEALGTLTGYCFQHVSEVERAKAPPSESFIAACDRVLEARGRLLTLLPAVNRERATQRQQRADARRAETAALRSVVATHSEVAGEDDVEPTDRRGLLGAGAAAAVGAAGFAAMPVAACEVDPELPAHLTQLLNLLGCHDAAFGAREVLDIVQRELLRIGAHREVARGELSAKLLCVESRWAGFAAWLSSDAGELCNRDAWADRALRLATEADYPDMAAFVRSRQSQWALQNLDARRAIAFAEAALRISGTRAQTRALCASWAALGHALAGDTTACQRRLADARDLAEHADSPAPAWAGEFRVADVYLRTTEARCWLWMQPSKAITLYESILRSWQRDRMRTGGLHQARLALACAAAGERDRAAAEGRKALAIARATRSRLVARELKQLDKVLAAS